MKYQQPFGVLDPDASYEDGNRVTGTKGSIPPAKAVEAPQREIVHVISYFGLTPDGVDNQQLRKAIEAAIAAATGGGDTADYLLMTQARARLPIFPEIQTADGRINVSSPGAGTILVPPAVTFQHRGIYPVSTSDYPEIDRTFETVANKTYHLRWAYGSGFSLEDVADAGDYNPTVLPEQDAAFDSTYDDMLIARVVTNSSNVATITNLANKNRLEFENEVSGAGTIFTSGTGSDGVKYSATFSLNWARSPLALMTGTASQSGARELHGLANRVVIDSKTRYAVAATVDSDFNGVIDGSPSGRLRLMATR